jgi:hypothetical protein
MYMILGHNYTQVKIINYRLGGINSPISKFDPFQNHATLSNKILLLV